jgi:hypothetical protein
MAKMGEFLVFKMNKLCFLSKFSDNKLLLNHLSSHLKVSIVFFFKIERIGSCYKYTCVIGKKMGIESLFKVTGRSLNSKGPRMEP